MIAASFALSCRSETADVDDEPAQPEASTADPQRPPAAIAEPPPPTVPTKSRIQLKSDHPLQLAEVQVWSK